MTSYAHVIGCFRSARTPRGGCSTSLPSTDVSSRALEQFSPATYGLYSLQQNAKHPETFAPHVISLPPKAYVSMVRTMNLPYRGIESTSAVGPIFWAAYDQDEQTPHLRKFSLRLDTSPC
jgi:hypothetical protein